MLHIIGTKITHFHELDSSNNRANLKIRQNDMLEGEVIYTDFQTQGKGQKGQTWESAAGENLLCSVYIKPHWILADQQFIISQFVSIALVEYLQSLGLQAKIKWPNDILVDDYKIAGILIENTLKGTNVEHTVLGIGLNVNQTEFLFVNKHKPTFPPISLKDLLKQNFDLEVIINKLCANLNAWYIHLYSSPELIQQKYLSYLYRYQEWALYWYKNTSITAKIEGINAQGRLILTENTGKTQLCDLKEIQFL